MKEVLLICGLFVFCVSGHMQMSKPFPIRSPLNDASGQKDYSYTNPLSPSGSNYPCKGYANDPFHPVAEYSPGREYEMKLEGSVTHGGGSCQISLSYNKGETFHVIHSMLGGCPITKTYNFKIPSDAPSGDALLAWTWFNKVGNREMYMNCAQITIKDDSLKREHLYNMPSSLTSRSSFNDLPPIFIANVNGPGKCTTFESQEANFPLPGLSVEGSLSGKGYECKRSASFLGSSSSDSCSGSSCRSGSGSISLSNAISASVIHTPMPRSTYASTNTQYDATSDSRCCTPGMVICASDGQSWSVCANGTPVHMGPVAAGTFCRNNAIDRKSVV